MVAVLTLLRQDVLSFVLIPASKTQNQATVCAVNLLGAILNTTHAVHMQHHYEMLFHSRL